MTRIVHKLNRTEVRSMLASPSGGLARNMLRRGHKVANFAKKKVGVRSGRLRSSITVVLIVFKGYPGVAIGSNVKYARWHHDGTGIYGPRHTLIRPKRAKVMVFKPKNGKGLVFAKSVKGSRPNHFLSEALIAAKL